MKPNIPSAGNGRYRGQYVRISLRVANTMLWSCPSIARFNSPSGVLRSNREKESVFSVSFAR